MPRAMTGRRRLQILNELAAAPAGVPMFDGQQHRFYAEEIVALDNLVTREHGNAGVYHITDEGRSYLVVMKVEAVKKQRQQVAA